MTKSESDNILECLKTIKQKLSSISDREQCELSKCELCDKENSIIIEEIENMLIDIMKIEFINGNEEIVVVIFTAYKYILDSIKYAYFLGTRLTDENRVVCKSIQNINSNKIIQTIIDKNLREYLWAIDECIKTLVINKYIKKNYKLESNEKIVAVLKDNPVPVGDKEVIESIDNLIENYIYKDFVIPHYLKISYYSYISNIDEKKEDELMKCMSYVNSSNINILLVSLSQSYFLPDLVFDKIWVISTLDRLRKRTEELNKLHEKNTNMIRRFSHAVTNLLYPEAVQGIAEKLSVDEKYQDEIQDLIMIYRSEKLFYQQSKMLELRHNSSSLDIQLDIIESISKESSEERVGVDYLILYCLQATIFRILVNKKSREISINNKLTDNGISIDKIKKSYYKDVLFRIPEIKKWFNEYLYYFDLCIDESWKSVSLVFDSAASALIIELLNELIFNALTYGTADKNSYLKLRLGEEIIKDISFSTLEIRNSINSNEVTYSSGTKEGLDSIEELLNLINCIGENYHLTNQYLIKKRTENEFYIKLLIRSDLIIA